MPESPKFVTNYVDLHSLYKRKRRKYERERSRRRYTENPHYNKRDIPKVKNGNLAVDSEGESDACIKCGAFGPCEHEAEFPRNHRMVLLAASDNAGYRHSISGHDIETKEALEFLVNLPPNKLVVAFSFGYDVNMILRDVPPDNGEFCTGHCCLNDLRQDNGIFWDNYYIEYIQRKKFYVADVSTRLEKKDRQHRTYGKSVTIFDTFGYFQCSFVSALRQHEIGTEEQVAAVENMKEKRGTFDETMSREVAEYCFLECDLLVQMMGKLIDSLSTLDLRPTQWMGAGSLAAAMFKKYAVKKYMSDPPEKYVDNINACYYGGRFEVQVTGQFSDLFTYDINSAYPHIITNLPCLKHLKYRRTKKYNPQKIGVWFVVWNIPENSEWGPFPFRVRGRIFYPLNGSGWYHAAEVAAAKRIFGDHITVHYGILFIPGCEHKPFAFVRDLFEFRKQLKAEKNYAQYTLKLAINSLYGKMAQRKGWQGEKPTYQSYLWAGMVTAGTRAMLLEATYQSPDGVLTLATDGITTADKLDLPTGKELGEWEYTEYGFAFIIGNGVYILAQTRDTFNQFILASAEQDKKRMAELIANKQIICKTRGFGIYQVNWAHIYKLWRQHPITGMYHYQHHQFIGFGAALNRTDENLEKYWRKWALMKRRFKFKLANRRVKEEIFIGVASGQRRPYIPYIPLDLSAFVFHGIKVSTPYTRKDGWKKDAEEFAEKVELHQAITGDQPG